MAAAGAVTYGADPGWMRYSHGLELILLSRRLQWPLILASLAGCACLIAMVAAGRWRAVWLIGLAPVLALFAHRFIVDPAGAMDVDTDPNFISADSAKDVADNDYVVGLTFDEQAYAYPYAALYHHPVVVQARPRQRLILLWSAFANRAVAALTDWTVKPRELEIVSEPANALLIYNSELGEFINGVTGLTCDQRRPTGFETCVPTVKMSWKQWRQLHPQTLVLHSSDGVWADGPTGPIPPRYPMGRMPLSATPVAFIQTPRPVMVREADVTAAPLNLVCGSDPLLLFRGGDGVMKAFFRQANGDLTPRFYPVSLPGHSSAVLGERDSNSSWTADGRAVEGPLKGEKLKPYDVDDQVYLEVLRFWEPNLQMIVPTPQDVGQAPDAPARTHRKAARKTRLRRAVAVTASF
jgi:Protein of unknown function (DUF3179)